MSFLSPWMLAGAAAVSIPIILHFFYKSRHRKLPWAAMEFLRQSMEQTSRRLKFQEWILLALRCLVLLLLALALARPTMTSSGKAGRGEAVDAVFVFDVSYSMAARDGEKTRLERAKDAALNVLDNLPPNSTIQILSSADRTTLLGPVSPRNLDQARQIIGTLDVTSLSTDFLPAITDAMSALDRGAGGQKEVYLFSDMQKSGFERQTGAVRAKAEELKQRATVLFVRCGEPSRTLRNVVLTDLTFPGGIPHKGARLPFTAIVKNNGRDPIRNLTMTLEVDGKTSEKESEAVPEIPPGGAVPVTLTAKLDEAGPRVVTAKLTGDDLPGDDRIDRIIPVRDVVRVLVVDGSPDPRDPRDSGSHFLRNALTPVASGLAEDYFVKVTVVDAEEAGPGLLGACDVCFLCNVPASEADRPGVAGLTPEFVQRLDRFIRDGGGVVIGLGDHVTADRYNLLLGSKGAKLLPFDLAQLKTAKPEAPFKPAPDTASSYLDRFRDDPFATVTADVDVLTTFGMVETGTDGRVLLRYSDQTPAVASKIIGEGEIILIGTGLDTRWANWPAKAGSYLSFVQFTLAHLTSRGTKKQNQTAGELLTYSPQAEGKGFDVIPPTGNRVRLGQPSIDPVTRKLLLSYADTSRAGLYQFVAVDSNPPVGPRFAVNPDLRESDDLSQALDDEIEASLGFRPMFLQAGSGAEQQIKTERSRREWTIWILLFVFAMAAFESAWAWICGKAW